MNYQGQKRFLLGLLAICLSIPLLASATSCGAPAQDQITIVDRKEVQKEAVVEELLANNCDGTEELTQDLKALKQFTHDVRTVGYPGVKFDRQAVENQIRQTYEIPEVNGEQICIVPVQVPARNFYAYDLEWREIWREGDFELGEPDEKPEGTYKFQQSVICEVVGQTVKTCP